MDQFDESHSQSMTSTDSETKELLGGFVILETESEEEALAIAKEWPSLSSQGNATVHLQPVFVRD